MAQFIPADTALPIVEVQSDNGTDFQLKQLYAVLSCDTIEVVSLPDDEYIMILDEEGKLTDKPRNERATKLAGFVTVAEMTAYLLAARQQGIEVIRAGYTFDDASEEVDYIAGDVLVCKNDELR